MDLIPEFNFYSAFHINWNAIFCCRLKKPFIRNGIDNPFIQSVSKSLNDLDNVDFPILANDSFNKNFALDTRLPSFFRFG